MKTLAELITNIDKRIESLEQVLQKWQKSANERGWGSALNWSQVAFDAAARIEVYRTVRSMAEAVDSSSDEKFLEYSSKELPPVVSESRLEWFKRHVQHQAIRKLDFSSGSLRTANVYREAVNSAWKDVATDHFSIWESF